MKTSNKKTILERNHTMKKKVLLLTVCALVASLLLAGCNGLGAVEPEYTTAGNGAQVITEDTAKRASTGSQSINSEDVTFTSVELETENGKTAYEVEFLYDGYKYKVDIDAETGDVLEVKKEAYSDEILEVVYITEEAALDSLFAKAGLTNVTKADLEYCEIELDDDGAFYKYEIEFVYNGVGYEADVSAVDGSVYNYEQWFIENADIDNDDDDDDDDDDKVTVNTDEIISKDDALAKALAHAGIAEADILGKVHVKLERDDGKAVYEIEFVSGYTEYDYDIDAVTGEVVSFDRDGEHASAPEASIPNASELIDKEAALAAAFAHAGIDAGAASKIEIELDDENGEYVYEIEFMSGEYEYSYDIDAFDGSVLRFDKEIDD